MILCLYVVDACFFRVCDFIFVVADTKAGNRIYRENETRIKNETRLLCFYFRS